MEELEVVRLKNNFYRDGFHKVLLLLGMITAAMTLLVATSVYLFWDKPYPVQFITEEEFRILPPVSLTLPFLTTPDLLQWVSDAIPTVFTYNFINYADELKKNTHYFSDNGWKSFLNVLNDYLSLNTVTQSRLFVNTTPTGAPFILNQGLLQGRYGWWVEMPIAIRYVNFEKSYTERLTLQILLLRESTLNNLSGVTIENIMVALDNKSSRPPQGLSHG